MQATESMSNLTLHHYWYTFQEVIEESAFLGLIEKDRSILKLTSLGNKLLLVSSKGSEKFNHEIFLLMESRLQGFRYLIEASYLANPENNGLLIFPVYSPLKLGMNKQEIVSSNNIREYAQLLREKIEIDIEYYLSQKISLDKPTSEIIKKSNTLDY
ncbi:MAG: hypothetical protein IPL24_15280 [Bacteroidetes bacterium]|nr:hypothetical protein [Bacteroidota bacterium]